MKKIKEGEIIGREGAVDNSTYISSADLDTNRVSLVILGVKKHAT